ncbi:U3-aranetoxin-Ce1a-like [Clytia hemisphaerica]|uniref:Uncharacterized protein n=1 Tax=Clytia hemisphaerica TaxID=252671 RepID=A0A7M5X9L0_9CNID|eukprot:TCONS_00067834-protein
MRDMMGINLTQQNLLIFGLCLSCLVAPLSATFEACRRNSQCKKGFCCAGPPSFGFCMRNKKLGELCSASHLLSKTFGCGCEEGLTCAIVSRKGPYTRLRCVEIPATVKVKIDDKQKNSTDTITKLLTAYELRHLLEVIKERPVIKTPVSSDTPDET